MVVRFKDRRRSKLRETAGREGWGPFSKLSPLQVCKDLRCKYTFVGKLCGYYSVHSSYSSTSIDKIYTMKLVFH